MRSLSIFSTISGGKISWIIECSIFLDSIQWFWSQCSIKRKRKWLNSYFVNKLLEFWLHLLLNLWHQKRSKDLLCWLNLNCFEIKNTFLLYLQSISSFCLSHLVQGREIQFTAIIPQIFTEFIIETAHNMIIEMHFQLV